MNNQKAGIREFHINQFPVDRIFVYLDEYFHEIVFSKIKKYKFKQFNKLFFDSRLNTWLKSDSFSLKKDAAVEAVSVVNISVKYTLEI